MPHHLISDTHEWINEIPRVPIYYYLAKPQPGNEWAWQQKRGKKTLLSLTLV